jgi:hypothetical protein
MGKMENTRRWNSSLAPAGGEGRDEGVVPQTQVADCLHQFQKTALVERPPHPNPLPQRGRGKSFEDFHRRIHVTGGISQ